MTLPALDLPQAFNQLRHLLRHRKRQRRQSVGTLLPPRRGVCHTLALDARIHQFAPTLAKRVHDRVEPPAQCAVVRTADAILRFANHLANDGRNAVGVLADRGRVVIGADTAN